MKALYMLLFMYIAELKPFDVVWAAAISIMCEAVFCSTCGADSESVSEWVDISLPAAQDVGLTLRRSVDAVNRLPVISVQVSAPLSLQTALLMRSKVGLSHTACTTEVKLALCQMLLGRGFGVSLAQCDTVIRIKDKETLSHITQMKTSGESCAFEIEREREIARVVEWGWKEIYLLSDFSEQVSVLQN